MNKEQLQLASTDDLITELMNRTDGLALVFAKTDEDNKPKIKTSWSKDIEWVTLIGMVETLKFQLIDQYHKEAEEK